MIDDLKDILHYLFSCPSAFSLGIPFIGGLKSLVLSIFALRDWVRPYAETQITLFA